MAEPNTPVKLSGDTDPRYGELTAAIIETINERGRGLLFVGVLGALRLAEEQVLRGQWDTYA